MTTSIHTFPTKNNISSVLLEQILREARKNWNTEELAHPMQLIIFSPNQNFSNHFCTS